MANDTVSKTVAFATLGCKVAQYETEAMREAFEAHGFRSVTENADFVVVNTCTVTAEADRKCRQAIRRLGGRHPNAAFLVVGCYAQSHPEELAALPRVAYVGGTADKMKTPEIALSLREAQASPLVGVRPLQNERYEPMEVFSAPRTRAYVKIADGCDCHCTYCAIPAARGPVRSRPPEDIFSEIERLARRGTYEVVLTGIETASYGRDRHDNYRLIDLLEEVMHLPIPQVRLGSLTPEILRGDFAERLAALPRLAPHFHLSVQSGSSWVLRLMKRRYHAEGAMEGIRALRRVLPHAHITCDMIVGFPGESKENFAETIEFSREANFLSMHIFPFSARRGTPAATFPNQVPEAEKAARAAALASLAGEMTAAHLAAAVKRGEPIPFLVETVKGGVARGHSPSFLPLTARGNGAVPGKLVLLRPTEVRDGCVLGEIEIQ